MPTPFAPVRQKGAKLTEQEIADLELGSLPAVTKGEDGRPEVTQAELALLEAQGATIREIHSDSPFRLGRENPTASEEGDVLFQYGKGQSQFTGRVKYVSDLSDKVWMWHPVTGEGRLQARASVIHLAHKGWLPRPPADVTPTPRTFPCPSKWAPHPNCAFTTKHDADTHFRGRHRTEYAQVQAAAQDRRQETMDRILERLAERGDSIGGNELAAAVLAMSSELATLNAALVVPEEPAESTEATLAARSRRR